MSIAAATFPSTPSAPADSKDAKAGAQSSEWDLSFHNLLDIINPLEHLPVIGTLYRAITGTHIGMPEKIAGDALYGGLWGAVSSVADAAFEKVTGKDFGDTVLSLFSGHHDTELANAAAAPAAQAPATEPDFGDRVLAFFSGHHNTQLANVAVTPAAQPPAPPSGPDAVALQAALSRNGVNGDLAQRAMAAYRKSILMPSLVSQPGS